MARRDHARHHHAGYLDGWSVLRTLKADPELREIPVVLLTIMRDRDLGFALGAVDYLMKLLDREVLMRVVARHCSLTTRRERLVKIAAGLRAITATSCSDWAEVAVPRILFTEILRRIERLRLRPPPVPA